MDNINVNKSEEVAIAAGQFFQEREYWLTQLAGKLRPTRLLADYPPPGPGADNRETVVFGIGGEVFQDLVRLSDRSDARLFIILVTGIFALLYKYTSDTDIIIGTTIDRQEVHGEFINTILPLRNRIEGDTSFKELLLRVRQTIIEANKNQNYPMGRLIHDLDIETEDENLFDVAVLLSELHDRAYLQDFRPDILFLFSKTADQVRAELEYNASRFRRETMARIGGHLVHLVGRLLSSPDQPLKDINILTGAETRQILFDFNQTAGDFPDRLTLNQLFEEQVERTPDRTALVEGDGGPAISYRELDEKADTLAAHLREKGVMENTLVALQLPGSVAMVTGMLAILKAGGAFLPIDPDYPGERIQYMLADSGAEVVIGPHGVGANNYSPLRETGVLYPVHGFAAPTDLAYVIYTSGTTGRPKGVMISHRSIVNQIYGLTRAYRFPEAMRHILLAPITFDPSVQQVFLPLVTGGELLLVSKAIRTDARSLWDFIRSRKPDILNTVPSLMSALLYIHESLDRAGEADSEKIAFKYVILAGEVFSKELYLRLIDRFAVETVINIYGPTEATINTTAYVCTPATAEDRSGIPIGKPLQNYRVYILDERLKPVPIGVPGELYLAGEGLARGYLNQPELTAERFVEADIPAGAALTQQSPSLPAKTVLSFACGFTNCGLSAIRFSMPVQGIAATRRSETAPLPKEDEHSFGSRSPLLPLPVPCTGKGEGLGVRGEPLTTHQSPLTNRLYRTGDLGRWLPDGHIEFLGRIDQQVKIRGMRVEPAEIDALLLRHEGIKEAFTLARAPGAGGTGENEGYSLCSYLVFDKAFAANISEIRTYLEKFLPDYMVPAYFVPLAAIPLTPNGKVDRRALPDPESYEKESYLAPRNEVEEKLARIWADALGLQQVGVRDNFFHIGGDSIKVIKLVNLINKALAINLNIVDLYIYGTIEALAENLDAHRAKDADQHEKDALAEIEKLKEKFIRG